MKNKPSYDELEKRLDVLHGAVIETGHLTCLGELTRGIAHEINNPCSKKTDRGKLCPDNPKQIMRALEKTGWNKAKAARSG